MNETFFESAVGFIQKHLWSENPIEKRAALVVYGCILEGPKPQFLADFLTQALPAVTDILFNSDHSEVLKQDASFILQRTFEVLPELFFQETLLNSRLQDLTNVIKAPSKISINIAKFWKNLDLFIADINKDFSLDFSEALGNFIDNIFNELDYEYHNYLLIEPNLVATGALISCLPQQEVKIKYINTLRERIKEHDKWNQERIQLTKAGFLSCIKIVLEKCQLNPEDPLVNDVFSLIDEISEAQGWIPSEGINSLEGLISALGPNSTAEYFEKIWIWIMKGFRTTINPQVFAVSLKAILKMAQTCPGQVKGVLGDIFKTLLALINWTGYQENDKVNIIEFVADLAGIYRSEILTYIEIITDIYTAGIELVTRNGVYRDENLKESLIKSFKSFFKIVADSENSHLVLNSVPKVMQFLMLTCSESWNPTVDYIRDVLDLVFEIVLKFKDKATENVKSEVVVSLVKKLAQFPDDPKNLEVINSGKQVFNYL